VVNRPTEEDQIDIVIKNLRKPLKDELTRLWLPNFPALNHVGFKIEENLESKKAVEEAKRTPNQFTAKKAAAASSSPNVNTVTANPLP